MPEGRLTGSGGPAAPMREGERLVPVWLLAATLAIFFLHAANYLYFFVDDEAIPYVYAQNLLHGKGLVYNAIEGRVEGYSDFLHVIWSTLILAATQAARLPKVIVFFVGKSVSLACGVGVIVLVWSQLRRSQTGFAGSIAGLGVLALGAPLALWSCSSLEAVPFALIATVLTVALAREHDGWAATMGALLVLERIDGFVYAGALITAFIITSPVPRRREMWRRIVFPVAVVFTAYGSWRWWYFRDLLPAPLEAKVLYKLTPRSNLLIKDPDNSYLMSLIGAYGWLGSLGLLAATLHGFIRGGMARRLTLAAAPLVAYVSLVGDWMFGFRFFVSLLPLFALIVASSVSALAETRAKIAAAVCVLSLVYGGVVAVRFRGTYAVVAKSGNFLQTPSRDLHRFFWPYYGIYEMAGRVIRPGEVVAYNQGGFVPFMLDLNNIDDLGICSRFPAEIPSTDIYFTEVGRYAPLTNKGTLRPVHTYLLYQNARFVISRTDILVRANHDTLPQAVLGGRYALIGTDANGLNALYRRDDLQTRTVTIEPRMFTENVAHVSYLRDVRIGGVRIASRDYIRRLPYFRDGPGRILFDGQTDLFAEFSDREIPLQSISVAELRSSVPVSIRIRALTKERSIVMDESIVLGANKSRSVLLATPGVAASRLVMQVTAATGDRGELWIDDLRVQGQHPALEEYVATHLRFPRAGQPDER